MKYIVCGKVKGTAGEGHGCGKRQPHYAVGLCHTCYRKLARKRRVGKCVMCRDGKQHILHTVDGHYLDGTAYGLCERHYMEQYRREKKSSSKANPRRSTK